MIYYYRIRMCLIYFNIIELKHIQFILSQYLIYSCYDFLEECPIFKYIHCCLYFAFYIYYNYILLFVVA